MFGFGAFFKTTTPAPKKEDSAFAIANLVLTSKARDLSDFYQWCSRREEQELFSGRGLSASGHRHTLNPFAIESFTQNLFRRLGIRTAPTRIVSSAEARQLPEKFVIKHADLTNTLRADFSFRSRHTAPTIPCIAQEIVPDAATFDFVRRKFGIDQGLNRPYPGMADVAGRSSENLCRGLTSLVLRKECRSADDLYADFKPSREELLKIRAAMRWDGEAFLKICAARVFIGCSAPHNANILVTRSGELVSIDHCTANRENGEDLRMLFKFTRSDSQAFSALADVAALTDADVRASVSEVPRHPAVGSLDGIADYFIRRLRLWQSLYEAAPSRAAASVAV